MLEQNKLHREQPLVVSIYAGSCKPQCLQSFLQPRIHEWKNLLQNGLPLDDCSTLSVILPLVLLFVRSNGDKCVQKEVRHERLMTNPLTESLSRDDFNHRQLRPNHSNQHYHYQRNTHCAVWQSCLTTMLEIFVFIF